MSYLLDARLKYISSRIAEASIKFDLLSVDPNCQVQLFDMDNSQLLIAELFCSIIIIVTIFELQFVIMTTTLCMYMGVVYTILLE